MLTGGRASEQVSRIPAPALRRHVSHAPAQLRLARTHERIEIEIDFPVAGGTHSTSSPLPPIYQEGCGSVRFNPVPDSIRFGRFRFRRFGRFGRFGRFRFRRFGRFFGGVDDSPQFPRLRDPKIIKKHKIQNKKEKALKVRTPKVSKTQN